MAAGDDSSVTLGSPTGNADTRLTVNGDHRQVVTLGNAGDRVVGVEPRNSLNVNLGPNTLFVDQWSGTLDTTDRWTVASGAAPSFSNGQMVMSATASTFNALRSKPTLPYTLGYQYVAMGIQLETTAAVGAGRFWGLGTQATSPTATSLVQDGVGFEIDQATGNLLAVTYAAGVRTTVATLTRPSDGALHRYAFHHRVTDMTWYIDGLDVPVATQSFPNIQVQELPVLIVRQNAATFTGTPVFTNIAAAVGDTSRMGDQLIDGTFPWRKATIKPASTAPVAADTALAVGLHPSAPLPAGTNTIGGVNGGALISTTGAVAAAATGTVGPLNVGMSGNVTFTIKNTVAASAWAGAPVVVFEQSDDNASWGPLVAVRSDNQVAASTHVLPAGTANGALMFDAPAESVTYVRARVTTGPTTNGITIDIAAGGMPFSPVVTSVTSPITSLPMGSTTGTTPALTGQVGRVVRATANVAQATAATLIAAPAAGTRLYITGITCANEGATLTVVRLFAGSLPAAAGAVAVINDCFDFPIAASGGGAALNFPPNAPWALPAATALSFAVTVATTWDVTVSYYVAA